MEKMFGLEKTADLFVEIEEVEEVFLKRADEPIDMVYLTVIMKHLKTTQIWNR
jgi:hypothetical protein